MTPANTRVTLSPPSTSRQPRTRVHLEASVQQCVCLSFALARAAQHAPHQVPIPLQGFLGGITSHNPHTHTCTADSHTDYVNYSEVPPSESVPVNT